MRTAGGAFFDSPVAVFQQSIWFFGVRIFVIAFIFILTQWRCFQEGNFFFKDALIASSFDIQGSYVREPQHVVRDTRSHTPTGRWVPPMHYIAFSELELSSIKYLATGNRRIDRKQGQNVLKLVAEAKCPAGLIES